MPVKVPLRPSQVSVEDLVQVYNLFCVAFGVQGTLRDEQFMRTRGVEDLREGRLDYRPRVGAKFFGERSGDSTRFHGYSSPEDPEWQVKDRMFQELVLQYFSQR